MSKPEVTLRAGAHTRAPAPVSPPVSPRPRLLWPDVAKGFSILGVCFLHATLAVPNANEGLFLFINDILGPIRMPLFFLVSGLFSLKLRDQTFSELWSRRLKFLLIPYFVWAPVEVFSHQFAVGEINIGSLLFAVLTGQCTLWFLHVLATFAIAVWITRSCSPFVALALSFSPMILLAFDPVIVPAAHIIVYLPAFFIGVFLRQNLQKLATMVNDWRAWTVAIIAYLVGMVSYAHVPQLFNWFENVPFFFLNANNFNTLVGTTRGLITIPLAVLLSSALSHLPYVRNALQWIGQRTLVIYIGHATVMSMLFTWPLVRMQWVPVVAESSWLLISLLVAYCLIISLGAGWIWSQMKKVPALGWTIVPRPLAQRMT